MPYGSSRAGIRPTWSRLRPTTDRSPTHGTSDMDAGFLGALLGLSLLVLLAMGVWVGISLFVVGLLAIMAFSSSPAGSIMATTSWGQSWSWALTALPLFIWMGEILFRTRLAEDMFEGLAPWMRRIPGRLMHVNVLGCGIFAAVSG